LRQIQLADSYASSGSLLSRSDFGEYISSDSESYHATGRSTPYQPSSDLGSVSGYRSSSTAAPATAAPAETALNVPANATADGDLLSGSNALGNLNLMRGAASMSASSFRSLEAVRPSDSLPLSTFLIRAVIVLGALTYVVKLHPSKAERSWDSLANGFFAGWLQ
jgi:hypothetical protein